MNRQAVYITTLFLFSLFPLSPSHADTVYEAAPTVAHPPSLSFPHSSQQPPTVVVPPPATVPLPLSPQPAVSSTITYSCVPSGNGYATVVSNGSRQAPLITWNSSYFGSQYTPENRCRIVTSRFQEATNRNGGRLSNLILTGGIVNSQTVICATSKGQIGCSAENMLFTLRPENAKDPGAVLTKIMNVGKVGSGDVVLETSGLLEVDLDKVINQALGSAISMPAFQPAGSNSGNESVEKSSVF